MSYKLSLKKYKKDILVCVLLIISFMGVVQSASWYGDIMPITNVTYDLGNQTYMWNKTYSRFFYGSGQYLTDLPGGVGESKWVDGGTYIYPNDTYAVNVWIKEGWLNVTSWFRVYSDVGIYGDLLVTGDISAYGNLNGSTLTAGEANFTGKVRAEEGMELNETFNHTDTGTYFYFDENGALVVHLET